MATMYLYFGSSITSVTVHANNNYYPKTFTTSGKTHTLSNLPSSGNIWIVPSNDVEIASGYTTPINITTQNPSGSWKLDNDNYVAITNGRSMTLTATKGSGGTTYTTYGLNLRTGTGISSYNVKYLGSSGSTYNTATVSNSSASTVCWTRASTNLEITSVNYADLYGSPFYFKEYTDSTFSTVKKTFADNDDQVYSSGTRYVKLFGTQTSYATYAINLRTGTGVNSYQVSYTNSQGDTITATVSNSAASTVCYVKANSNLEITSVNYADLYGSPFYFKEYTDSTFSTVKKTFADNDDQVYSSGTRYVKLFGTQTSYATYAINLRTGTGVNSYQVSYTNSQGDTITATVSNSAASTVCYVKANSNLTITSVNYATNYASPYIKEEYNSDFSSVIGTTSGSTINASGTKYFKIAGTYVEPTYTMYLRCGTGVKNFSVYRGDTYVSLNSSTSWSPVDLTESNKTVTIKNISHNDGYGVPDYVGFYASSTATSPASQISSSSGEFTITYASSRQYAQVSASVVKTPISLFYWNGSDANDTALIQTGKPFSNITANMWNRLNAKIQQTAEALGKSYTYTTVSSGNTMTAVLFNQARNGINSLPGRGSIPATRSKGDTVMAGYFNGVNSLKNGLNVAIQAYNA